MPTPRAHIASRQLLLLPRDLNTEFRALTDQRGHVGAYLIFHVLLQAVADAQAGRWVPPAGATPSVSGREWSKAQWMQGNSEFAGWRAILDGVGSSPSAVVRHRVAEYAEASGDPLAAWYPLRRTESDGE